jgi:hypothetical protein
MRALQHPRQVSVNITNDLIMVFALSLCKMSGRHRRHGIHSGILDFML